jgi:hypothetical protein
VNRVTISGTCFNGGEEWTTGFYLGSTDADAPDPAGTAALVGTAWETFWNGAGSTMFPSIYLTREVKVAHILETGFTDLDQIDYHTYGTPIAGGGANRYPPQIAMAATLTSNIQRGLASKGRMFLPPITFAIDGDTGKQTSGSMTAIANVFKAFLDDVNDAVTGQSIILASHGHAIKSGGVITGYSGAVNALVSGCRVGDVMDTQRRRRDSLQEIYTSRTLEGFF